MVRKGMLRWLFGIGLTVTALLVLGGLGATVYELRALNESLESLQAEGLFVHGLRGPNAPISISGDVDATVWGTVEVEGQVDVGRILRTVAVDGTVGVCDPRYVGCEPVEVRIVR